MFRLVPFSAFSFGVESCVLLPFLEAPGLFVPLTVPWLFLVAAMAAVPPLGAPPQPMIPPTDIATAIGMLDALDESFKVILKEACPELWDDRYHLPHSPYRHLDLVEMYAGTARLAKACEEAR